MAKRRILKEWEKVYIRNNYIALSKSDIITHLGITRGKLDVFLKKEGLKVPLSIMKKHKSKGQFKKGNIPFNKGLKVEDYMSSKAIEITQKTQFKKGNLPYNTRMIGTIKQKKDKDGTLYWHKKISRNKWILYQRYIWEKEYGEIPENYLIAFKDKDTSHFYENLEMISREELMLRNSHIDYHEEIIPTLALISKLNKKIKNNAKK